MSNKNPKRELTWVAKLGQWRKRRILNGKRRDFYLGTGDGPNDLASYRRALARWRKIEAELEVDAEKQRLEQRLEELRVTRGLAGSPEHRQNIDAQIDDLEAGVAPEQAKHRAQLRTKTQVAVANNDWEAAASAATAVAETGEIGKLTWGDLIDIYLAEQQRRYEHGAAVPNAPQRDRISGQRLISYRNQCSHLRQAWGDLVVPEDPAVVAHLLSEFRKQHQQNVAAGTLAASTFNERIKVVRHFLGWASRTYNPNRGRYYLPELPRNIAELCAKYQTKSTAKALKLETIHAVWNAAYLPLKAYIALGLNCGYYAVDIGHLRRDDIRDGYIIADRHKTGIPCRYKLWPLTQRLLELTMNGRDGYAYESRRGGLLWQVDPNRGKSGGRWCEIDADLAACRKRAKLTGVSFSMFRDSSSTHIEAIDRTLTDLFDGHKDQRMARYYVDGERLDLDRMYGRLDKAIDELETIYGLALE